MKINDSVYLVASGALGAKLTDPLDCNVYAVDAGDQWFLIDAGCGRATDRIVQQMTAAGIDLHRVRTLFLTHGHADHAAGARSWRDRLEVRIVASAPAAQWLGDGNRDACGLTAAIEACGYPADFPYPTVDVQARWRDGRCARFSHGELQAIRTDGHGAGHLSFLWRTDRQVTLFSGDALLPGGTVLLTTLPEANLHQAIDSARRLARCQFDWLCPGHGLPQPYEDVKDDLDRTRGRLDKLLPPENFL